MSDNRFGNWDSNSNPVNFESHSPNWHRSQQALSERPNFGNGSGHLSFGNHSGHPNFENNSRFPNFRNHGGHLNFGNSNSGCPNFGNNDGRPNFENGTRHPNFGNSNSGCSNFGNNDGRSIFRNDCGQPNFRTVSSSSNQNMMNQPPPPWPQHFPMQEIRPNAHSSLKAEPFSFQRPPQQPCRISDTHKITFSENVPAFCQPPEGFAKPSSAFVYDQNPDNNNLKKKLEDWIYKIEKKSSSEGKKWKAKFGVSNLYRY